MLKGMFNQSTDYPNSYYAATRHEKLSFPKFAGEDECDIAIVGAGFSGLATGLFLTERGYKVAVFEACQVGWGASGRNGGQVVGGFNDNQRVRRKLAPDVRSLVDDVFYRGHEIITDWSKRYNIASNFEPGQLVTAAKPSHLKWLREDYENACDQGYGDHVSFYDSKQLHDILDTPLYHGGVENRMDGAIHPLNLCLGEARAATKLGMRVFEQSPVLEIQPGLRPKIKTAQGTMTASQVVLAGNAYHLLKVGRLVDGIVPVLSYVATTNPIDPDRIKQTNPRRLAIYDSNNIIDYYRFTPDNRLLFGGRCDYANFKAPEVSAMLMPRMRRVFPQFADLTFDYTWYGHIGVVLNRIPMLGRLPGNVYYLQGYSGHGIALSHVYSELVAQAIAGDSERFDHFANIGHWTLPGARRFSNVALALGMQFYKLRDALPF